MLNQAIFILAGEEGEGGARLYLPGLANGEGICYKYGWLSAPQGEVR